VTVTVKYTLIPSAVEKVAETVFTENIQLIGYDGKPNGPVIANFAQDAYTTNGQSSVLRTKTKNVPKSTLNEDKEYKANGAEEPDEIQARITIGYGPVKPNPQTLPPPTVTNTIKDVWK
jgi:hypothetical protein